MISPRELAILHGKDLVAMVLKLLPVGFAPQNAAAGVPVASPRTMTARHLIP